MKNLTHNSLMMIWIRHKTWMTKGSMMRFNSKGHLKKTWWRKKSPSLAASYLHNLQLTTEYPNKVCMKKNLLIRMVILSYLGWTAAQMLPILKVSRIVSRLRVRRLHPLTLLLCFKMAIQSLKKTLSPTLKNWTTLIRSIFCWKPWWSKGTRVLNVK